MNYKNDFFIAGRTRNKDQILKICNIFDKYNIFDKIFKNEEELEIFLKKYNR